MGKVKKNIFKRTFIQKNYNLKIKLSNRYLKICSFGKSIFLN